MGQSRQVVVGRGTGLNGVSAADLQGGHWARIDYMKQSRQVVVGRGSGLHGLSAADL